MKYLLLYILCVSSMFSSCSSVIAGSLPEVTYESDVTLDGTHHLGNILHQNRIAYGLNDEDIILETPYGEITLKLNRTWNQDCDNGLCPDQLTVVSTPPNTVVVPQTMITPEQSTGTMKFYKFIGN